MVQANNKEITVTLTEKSHKHAEMMIYKAVNPELVVFVELNGVWIVSPGDLHWFFDSNHFLCHPNHTKECLHWLNGGDVEFLHKDNDQWVNSPKIDKIAWSPFISMMSPDVKFRIKQEPEYVKVESIYDLNRDEQYYTKECSGDYLIINEHATEDYILLQLNGGGLYRKVEKGE